MSGIVNVRGARTGIVGTITGTTAAGGITHSSQWVVGPHTGVDIAPYTAWAELEEFGGALTESSGIFTFPVTGFWLIWLRTFGSMSGTGYVNTIIMKTLNNSTYVNGAFETHAHPLGGQYLGHSAGPYLFDVTDVSQCKVRFDQGVYQATGSGGYVLSHSATVYNCGASFVRLGDT